MKQQRNRTTSRRLAEVLIFTHLLYNESLVISRFDKCKASWVKASDLKTGATQRSLRSDMSSVCYNCWTSSKDKTTEAHWNPTYNVATSAGVLMMGEAGSSKSIRESTWSGDNDWWRVSFGFVKRKTNIIRFLL